MANFPRSPPRAQSLISSGSRLTCVIDHDGFTPWAETSRSPLQGLGVKQACRSGFVERNGITVVSNRSSVAGKRSCERVCSLSAPQAKL